MIFTIRNIFALYVFTFLISINLTAQQKNISSLKEDLKVENKAKNKVSLLLEIGELYINEQPDSSIAYSNKALKISQDLNYKPGIAESYLLQGKSFSELKDYKMAITFVRKAENIYFNLNDEIGLGKCYFEKSYPFCRLSNTDSCSFYLEKSFDIFKSSNDKLILANIEKVRALNHWSLGEYGNGLISIDKAINSYRELNDSINLSKSLNTKGAILWGFASYKNALDNFFESLEIKEKLGDKNDQIIIAYSNIGLVYADWGHEESALRYYKKAEELIPYSRNKLGIAYIQLNLGTHFLRIDELEKAQDFLIKAKEGYAEIGDASGVCLCKIRIAQVHNKKNEHTKAKDTYLDALHDAEKIKNNHRVALANYYLAKNELSQNKLTESLKYSNASLELAKTGEYNEVLYLVYEQQSNIYELLNKQGQALAMLKSAVELSGEIHQKKMAIQYEILQLTRENEQKEFENNRLQNLNNLKEKTIRFQTLAVTLIILLLGAISFYSYYLIKRKKELQQANQAKDKIFSIVSHDLRGPVGNLNNMIEMLVSEEDEEDYRNLLHLLKPVITSSYNMLENLLVWAKSNLGKLEFKGEDLSLNATIKETIHPFIHMAEKKSISLIFEPSNDFLVFADKVLLETTIRNLVNNAIKFTNELGKIELTVESSKKQAIISVTDNGVGISKEKQETLFSGNKHTLGTNKETGSGLGLFLSKELAEKNGGNLWVKSTEGRGSTFSFSVPLNSKSW